MRVRFALVLIYMILAIAKTTFGISPYSILKIGKQATDSQIQRQYKSLRSKNRNSRTKKSMIRKAYNQIMLQRQLHIKQGVVAQPKASYFPAHIDEAYLYGYKLRDQFDDGSYFRQNFNETHFIIERQTKSDSNKKTASLILVIGGIIFKMVPCLIICCLCRRRAEGGMSDALGSARAGYGNIGRRGRV